MEGDLYGCIIVIHKNSYLASGEKPLKEFRNLSLDLFMKYKWYFRYLTAKYQVQNPKRLIEIKDFSYPFYSEAEIEHRNLTNRLRSAKAKVTEWTKKLQKFIDNYDEIFPYQEHLIYKRALAKVKAKEKLVIQLQLELEKL